MIDALINQLRQQVGNVIANLATAKIGLVNTVDPTTFTCVVEYQPENEDGTKNLSPSLPVITMGIGNGFGVGCLPNIGDQVYIIFEEGSPQGGAVVGGIFSDVDVATGMQAGEPFIIHQNGSYLKLTNDGKVSLNGSVEIDLTAPVINITTTGDVNLNVGGDLNADVIGNATIMGSVVNVTGVTSANITAPEISLGSAGGSPDPLVRLSQLQSYNDSHIHTNGNGGGNTGAPTVAMPNNVGTNVVSGE